MRRQGGGWARWGDGEVRWGRGRVAQQDSSEHGAGAGEGNIKTFPVSSQFVSGSAELVWSGLGWVLGIRTCAIMPGSGGGEAGEQKSVGKTNLCSGKLGILSPWERASWRWLYTKFASSPDGSVRRGKLRTKSVENSTVSLKHPDLFSPQPPHPAAPRRPLWPLPPSTNCYYWHWLKANLSWAGSTSTISAEPMPVTLAMVKSHNTSRRGSQQGSKVTNKEGDEAQTVRTED